MNQPLRHILLMSTLLGVGMFTQGQSLIPSPQFGTDGLMNVVFDGTYPNIVQHDVTSDGWLIVGATTDDPFQVGCQCTQIRLAKMDAWCGVPDPDFGTDGQLVFGFGAGTVLNDLVVLPNGGFLVAGMNAETNGLGTIQPTIYKFLPNGAPDTSFNSTGYRKMAAWPPSADIGFFWKIIPAQDGKFYAVGATGYDPGFSAAGVGVMRFLHDGELDTTYSADGIAWMGDQGTGIQWDKGSAVLTADSSMLITAMRSGQLLDLARFTPEGVPDAGFGTNGLLTTTMEARDFVETGVQADGKFLVSTHNSAEDLAHLGRFNADGSLDATFGTDGISNMPVLGGGVVRSRSIAIDSEGNSYQAVTWENSGNILHYIVKRDPDGQPFAGFGANGVFTITDAPLMSLYDLSLVDDDRLLLTGGYVQNLNAVRLTTSLAADRLVTLGPDTSACIGSSVQIIPVRQEGISLLWSDGTPEPSLIVSTSGTYAATSSTIGGCTQTDTIVVSISGPAQPVITADGDDLVSSLAGDLQWALDGTDIPGADQDTFTPTENGVYTVTITDVTGCTATSAPYSLQNVGLSERSDASMNISIHPNPASENVVLDLTLAHKGRATVELQDELGRVVVTLVNGAVLHPGTQRLNLAIPACIAPGNYQLVLNGPNGRSALRLAVMR